MAFLYRQLGVAAAYLFSTALSASAQEAPQNVSAEQERPEIEALDLDRIGAGPTPWTSLEALDADAQFHFVIVTDRTGGHREGIWAEAMHKINLTRPAFVVSVGDLVEGYTEDRDELDRQWDEFTGMVDELIPPFFYVPGNHDYSNVVMSEDWSDRFGPSYYAFRYKETLFVTLNSSIFNKANDAPSQWIKDHNAQMAWLQTTLTENSDVRWTYLFMHHPFWREFWWRTIEGDGWLGERGARPDSRYATAPAEWLKIRALLAERDYTAFAGHTHTYEYDAELIGSHSHEHISLATTGGGVTIRPREEERRTELKGPEYAEFDHFVWVTMTKDGPVIANMLLDGILPKDFDHFFAQPPLNSTSRP